MQRLTNKVFGAIAAGLMMLLLAAPGYAQIAVNVTNSVEVEDGESGTIAVYVGALGGEGVLGYDFTLDFDASVITITDHNADGTLSDGMSIESNSPSAGTFSVAAATGTALEGDSSGVLIWLQYEAVAAGSSSIELTSFQFNEGDPAANLADVAARLPHTGAEPNSDFVLPVFSDDIGGEGVLGYEFTVTYDADVITLDGIQTENSISANASVEFNAGDGTITVAAAQGSQFEAGSGGVLIYLTGTSAVEGTTVLSFTNVQFNEGDPSGAGLDGSIEVGVGLDTDDPAEMPESFALHGNYPNPFNPSTTIRFDLPSSAAVSVQIFDVLGREVMAISSRMMQAGTNLDMQVNASTLTSGTYLYRVTARTATETMVRDGQMLLVK